MMDGKAVSKQHSGNITVTWDHLWNEFAMEREATGCSRRTVEVYGEAVVQLRAFLRRIGLADDVSVVTAEHIRHFLAELARTHRPATVNNRYRALHRFFGWLVDEGERTDNPLSRIPTPRVPQEIVPALRPDEVRAVLAVCNLKEHLGVRDYAIVLTLLDTGLRASEFLSMQVDPGGQYEYVRVMGKGGRERVVRLGTRARQAILRYARVWRLSGSRLWVGLRGPLNRHGLYQIFRRLERATGLRVYPHLMRHTFASLMMGSEAPAEAIRTLAGWESDAMLRRYTRSREMERALEVHRRFSPADRLLE